ncbi:MAG: TRAP transporter small permease subunit [Betaproteobacteria bacterium]|nr:TRAP transporter small permease subunit [Betaproteobacteria bacterium]
MDVVWENLKPAGQRLLDLMSTLITLVFLGFMAWMVWVKVSSVGRQTTSDLQIRLDYFYAVAALGATAAVVLAALRVINLWRATSPEHPSEHQLGS